MKVLFLALDAYSSIGGIQQFNRRIINALSELIFENKMVFAKVILKGDHEKDLSNIPSNVTIFGSNSSKIDFCLKSIQSFRDADILLLGHVNLLPFAFMAKIINPKINVKLFVHGVDVWGVNSRKIKKLDRSFIKFVDDIASVSSFTAHKMNESFLVSQDKFTIFPNAVDPLEQTNVNHGLINKAPILLTVARLSENERGKHHDSVLRALPMIIQVFPDVKYQIIGDGVLRKELEGLAASLGVSDAVEFKGRVSDEDLAKSYEEALIFVMPSEKEGFGIVFLEAWLRNVPVICGTEDASHEVVSHGVDGFAIHHDDIGLIAEKIIHLLTNPDEAKLMGQLGEQKVREKYLMSNFITNLFNLLNGKG